jgi:hypothetical protein
MLLTVAEGTGSADVRKQQANAQLNLNDGLLEVLSTLALRWSSAGSTLRDRQAVAISV